MAVPLSMEIGEMKIATGMALAGFLALSMTGIAQAQSDPMSMFQCNTSCSTNWSQCLFGGTDVMLATTPQEGMNKMQMNSQNAMTCAEQARACYSSCM
jgi:hypothetical protein